MPEDVGFCTNCGQPARAPGKRYCTPCFKDRRQDQRRYENLLNRARNAAIAKLRERYPEEWKEIYRDEKLKLRIDLGEPEKD